LQADSQVAAQCTQQPTEQDYIPYRALLPCTVRCAQLYFVTRTRHEACDAIVYRLKLLMLARFERRNARGTRSCPAKKACQVWYLEVWQTFYGEPCMPLPVPQPIPPIQQPPPPTLPPVDTPPIDKPPHPTWLPEPPVVDPPTGPGEAPVTDPPPPGPGSPPVVDPPPYH